MHASDYLFPIEPCPYLYRYSECEFPKTCPYSHSKYNCSGCGGKVVFSTIDQKNTLKLPCPTHHYPTFVDNRCDRVKEIQTIKNINRIARAANNASSSNRTRSHSRTRSVNKRTRSRSHSRTRPASKRTRSRSHSRMRPASRQTKFPSPLKNENAEPINATTISNKPLCLSDETIHFDNTVRCDKEKKTISDVSVVMKQYILEKKDDLENDLQIKENELNIRKRHLEILNTKLEQAKDIQNTRKIELLAAEEILQTRKAQLKESERQEQEIHDKINECKDSCNKLSEDLAFRRKSFEEAQNALIKVAKIFASLNQK